MNAVDFMSPDLVRLALVLGMVLSIVLYEKSHLTTGSIVVPGFLGIHILDPQVIIFSVVNAVICFWFVHRLVSRLVLLSPQSKFQLLVVSSVTLQLLWSLLSKVDGSVALYATQMSGMGFVIPGLIAHDMARNGVFKTAANCLLISGAVGLLVFLLLWYSPGVSLRKDDIVIQPATHELTLIIVLSIVAAIFLRRKTFLSTGGYISAGFLVTMGISFFLTILLIFVSLVTYWINCRLLMRRMIIFGRRKFSLMLVNGGILTWSLFQVSSFFGIEFPESRDPRFAGVLILIPGLIANEIHRFGLRSVVTGCTFSTLWIIAIANLYLELGSWVRPQQVLSHVMILVFILAIVTCMGKPARYDSVVMSNN